MLDDAQLLHAVFLPLVVKLLQGLPVLFRKYFSCSAKLACFNVDPLFNNSLDGLIFMRLSEFPVQTLKSLLRGLPEDMQKMTLTRFYGANAQI